MGTPVVEPRLYTSQSQTAWGAIFGGTFVYIAIMSTFGFLLSSAIFASAGWNSTGFLIWNTIVAIISLYFAGRATSHLAAISDRNLGAWHGIVTFGMSFVATVLVLGIALGSAAPYSQQAAANSNVSGNLISVAGGGGWALWCAMFLGFIAAAIGGANAVRPLAETRTQSEADAGIRRVA